MPKWKVLYLECKTGISGDMTVAALLDLGADREKLLKALDSLNVESYEVKISQTSRGGIGGCDFYVDVHDQTHGHDHHHAHAHEHPDHRGLPDIFQIIDGADLAPGAARTARKIFEIIAAAEAKAHGIDIEKVHFHEIGAIDSIVDIVGAAVCLDDLGIEEVIVTSLTEGRGTVTCRHGVLPVPVPAVLNIASAYHIPLEISDVDSEMVTPTGAGIVAAVRTKDSLPERFVVEKIGIGLGKRDLGRPNLLRAMILSPVLTPAEKPAHSGKHVLLETNIDDSTGEQLGLAMERLVGAGASDAHCIPCFMKKNRPGYLLRVQCKEADAPLFEDIIFRVTTTIGIRKIPFEGTMLRRESIAVDLPCGKVRVKKCFWQDSVFYYPEYESVKQLSENSGRAFSEIFAEAKVQADLT
ncbi:MAG: nickel pincer cofactor biosynthesis protein LarC [Synergistaceae bacterium]|jgi:uncharacterized protein (TIGR00299 family) protein|nr:nickel pincer cofactor biosynthesis protein LarC [Synergistaceae bacterium]